MEITDVKLAPTQGEGTTRAMASVTYDNAFVVHGLRVVEGDKGLFVAMPQRKDTQGNYRDIAHPITSEARALLAHTVLEAYEKAIERGERPRTEARTGLDR